MKQVKGVLIGLAFAAAAAGSVEARPRSISELVLASAPAGSTQQIIDGRVWCCLGTGCRGSENGTAKSQPMLFECQRVAAQLGAVTSYRSRGRELGAGELAQCNSAAARR